MSAGGVRLDGIAGTWRFDRIHSAATFTVKYLVAPFRAEFERFDATLVDGRLSGSVDVTSLNLKDERFRTQVWGSDFFDVVRFPEISFASTDISVAGDGVIVDGELTLKGVTGPIRAVGTIEGPTADFMGNVRLGLALTATIDRTDYGLGWNAPLPAGGRALADDVLLVVDVEFLQGD
jgi:polyisoprenoid-binding protein YceI